MDNQERAKLTGAAEALESISMIIMGAFKNFRDDPGKQVIEIGMEVIRMKTAAARIREELAGASTETVAAAPTGTNIDNGSTLLGEPPPIPNSSQPSWEVVIADIDGYIQAFSDVRADAKARDSFGRAKYKTPLQPGNGRNSLKDAYEESLDKTVYIKNAMIEQHRVRLLIEGILDARDRGDYHDQVEELRRIIKNW